MASDDLFRLFDGVPENRTSTESQSLDSISEIEAEQDQVVRKASLISDVDLKVDYSDFANFVTFNSAYEYFTITAERMVSQYPIDGTVDDLLRFEQQSDGYQRYVTRQWPSRTGHLRFNPAASSSYIKFDDVGSIDGVTKTSLLSPGTGSFSVQCWYDVQTLTGSNDVLVVFQKASAAGDGYTLYMTGSQVRFRVQSGSSTTELSAALGSGRSFVAASCDRSATSGTLFMLTASFGTFPKVACSASLPFFGRFDLGSSSFYIGSGSLASKNVRPFTGSLDDVSVWSIPRGLQQLTSSYNRKVYAQSGLLAAWRFNESANIPSENPLSAIVKDAAGHRLDGRIQRYFPQIRGSGSLAYDSPDPILTLDDPNVMSFVTEQQTSGTDYDSTNSSKVTDLLPAAFSNDDSAAGAKLFRDFMYVVGRQLDSIKLYIDQLSKFNRVEYGDYDQAPDVLLPDVAKFYGWDLPGSFVDADAAKYILGLAVSTGSAANDGLSSKLYEIKDKFWKRTLLNLSYLYKTKGTRESVESLMRVYGVNPYHVKLKEYGRGWKQPVSANRIYSERSSYSLWLGSGSLTSSVGTSVLSSSIDTAPSSSLNFAASSSFVQFEQYAQPFPSSSAEFFALAGARPKHIFLCQETSGDGITCSITGERLGKPADATGVMCGATASGFWYNNSFTGKKCLEFSGRAPNHVFSASLPSFFDVGSGSFYAMCVLRMPISGNVVQFPFGKYDNNLDIGFEGLSFDGNRISLTVRDSPAGFSTLMSSASFHNDGAWHIVGYGLSKTSGTIVHCNEMIHQSSSAAAVTGSVNAAVGFKIGSTRVPDFTGCPKMQVAYVALFTGSDAEQMMAHRGSVVKRDFWKHASASYSEYKRSGDAVLTEVGSDEYGVILAPYATFRPGYDWPKQVPYIYQAGFSGSQSVGIMSTPSYANYLKYPQNISAWSGSSVSVNPGTSSGQLGLTAWAMSPWRMRSTSIFTGSAASAFVSTDTSGLLAGGQWYCASIYVSAPTAHSCTLEIQDTSGNVVQTKNVPVTTTWARQFVSGVLPSASSSLKFVVYVANTKGALAADPTVRLDGAQVNEGPYPLPLITNAKYGSANNGGDCSDNQSALTGTYIAVNVGAGQVPNSAGRVDVLYRALSENEVSGTVLLRAPKALEPRTIVDIVPTVGGTAGRRQLAIVTGTLRGRLVDSTPTTYDLVMSASLSYSDANTAILRWNQSQVTVPNLSTGHDGLLQSTSQSFTPGTNAAKTIMVGHASASLTTSGSAHLYGAVSRIVLYSGSILDETAYVTSSYGIAVRDLSIETRLMVPTTGNTDMPGTRTSGSIWRIQHLSREGYAHLSWRRDSADMATGSLILALPSASLTMSSLPIFNDRWHHIAVVREATTGSITMHVNRLEDGAVTYSTSSVWLSSSISGFLTSSTLLNFCVGSSASLGVQQWQDEFRIWSASLSPSEVNDHVQNYRSYGKEQTYENRKLLVHWRLDEGNTAGAGDIMYVTDVSMNNRHATGTFASGTVPYKKFLNGYNHIVSPDYDWREDKIQTYDGDSVPRSDLGHGTRMVALEMNLIDALNEDLSQLMSSYDEMNDVLGLPTNKFRESYEGLQQMRETYFRRLQGNLNFRVFSDMLDFFDRTFVTLVKRLLPARAIFTGDEFVVESHMLERPKYQYQARPVRDDLIIIEGSISMYDRGGDE